MKTEGRYGMPDQGKIPRYVVEMTSDAFEDPFIIRDTKIRQNCGCMYYALNGIIQTFESDTEAQEYADALNDSGDLNDVAGMESLSYETLKEVYTYDWTDDEL